MFGLPEDPWEDEVTQRMRGWYTQNGYLKCPDPNEDPFARVEREAEQMRENLKRNREAAIARERLLVENEFAMALAAIRELPELAAPAA